VTQLVLPLHKCATESIANPIAVESVADLAATEPLHSVVDPVAAGATLTQTSYLCVQV
jgi:hypothetical protein